jgi:hypothetical protein
MLGRPGREFPAVMNPTAAGTSFAGWVFARVVLYVHPIGMGLNQKCIMERISRGGEGICKGYNFDWQS